MRYWALACLNPSDAAVPVEVATAVCLRAEGCVSVRSNDVGWLEPCFWHTAALTCVRMFMLP
jgi:hypothetical protein